VHLKIVFAVLFSLWAVIGNAEPPVTGVIHSDFSDVADLALRQAVLQLPQVDVAKYPKLKPLLDDTIALVQKLTIPEDGSRPIRVVFVDDMSPNMGFARTTKGPHILKIHLGALHYFNDDSELAYMIGHELEHSLSRLNEEAREQTTAAKGNYWAQLQASLVHRVGENEVDVKSVFRRVHKKGYSPYSAINLIERLIETAGDSVGITHTKLTNRRNTIELELVGMSRLLGEKRNHVPRNDILKPEIKEFFRSKEFLDLRMKEAQKVATGYERLADEFVLAVKDIETAITVDQQKVKEAIADKKLAQLYARYKQGSRDLEHHLQTTAPQAVLLDEQLKLRAAVARALRLAQEKYFPNVESFRASRQYSMLRKAALLDLRSEISVNYQRGPLETVLDRLDRIERELAKLGTRAQDRSRRFTLERDLKKYKMELELMLSGFENPNKALAETRKSADYLDNIYGGLIPEEYFVQHGAIDHLQKHVGPELKAREEWLLKQRKHLAHLYLSDPNFDPTQLMETFRDLSKKEQREIFPKLLPEYLKLFQQKLREAKTDEEYQHVANQAKKIFAYSWGHSWDLRDELIANPSAAAIIREYFRTLLEEAPSAKALGAVSPVIEARQEDKALMLGAFPGPTGDGPIQMNAWAAALVYDSEMLNLELTRRLTEFEESLKGQESKSLPDFFAQASELFKTTDSRMILLNPREQRAFQDTRMNLVLKMAEESIPAKIQTRLPNWREVIRAATRIRLYRTPQNLERAEIARLLATIEKSFPSWEADDETAKFLGKALNPDGWLAFHDQINAKKDGLRKIVNHPTAFLNGYVPDGEATNTEFGNRKALLSFLWHEEPVRDERLGTLHQLLYATSFEKETPYKILGKLYLDELWRKASPKPKTLQDFGNFLEPIVRNAPSLLSYINPEAVTGPYKLADAQVINLVEALRQAHLKTLKQNDPQTINQQYSEDAQRIFKALGISERLDKLPVLERTRHLILTTIKKTGPGSDGELDRVLELAASDSEAKKLLMDPKIVGNFYYEVTRRNFALWQLQQQFQLDSIESHLKGGKLPTIQQRRQIVGDIQKWVDAQFPRNQPLKDTVLNAVEDKLLTSPAESQLLASSRLSFANWERLPEVVLVDLPEVINGSIESSFDRLQLLEYFTGRRAEVPDFILRAEKRAKDSFRQDVSALAVAQDLRVRFVSSPLPVRTAMLQTLLDQDFGILAEPETEMSLKQMVLGKNYDNKLFRTLFETYLDSLPKAERKPVYGSIVASMADAPKGSRGVSLKVVLEAMGPFGIKAGQFLRTSGLVSEEIAADLDGFLDRALPPDRSRIANDLQKRFGDNIEGFEIVRNLVGSGSINYVVRIDFKKPLDGEKSAVVRIRRPKIEGQVFNENELWATVAKRIRSEDPEVAEVIEEARGHTYETLKEGGTELDLSIEVRNERIAQQTYGRKISNGPARGFEVSVGHPLEGFQKLLLPNQESETAIYRFVDATPLDEIKDPSLRAALAAEIVNSELTAVFEKGVFDPDGHPGNWLVDLKNKRLVRIDYAQLRTLRENDEEFRKVFKELISGRPNFKSAENAKALAKLLRAEGVSPELLERAIVKVATSMRFSKSRVPQTQLFDLRRALRKELGVNVSSSDELRAGMAAIAKVRGFARYLPKGDFEILVASHAKLPFAKPLMWLKAIKDWAQGEKRIPGARVKEPSAPIEPLRPETRLALENLTEVTVLSPAKNFRAGTQQTAAAAAPVVVQKEQVFKLGSINWSPSSREDVHLLTPDEFERLPLGTVVHSTFDKLERIKGVHEMDLETRFGRTGWGLRGAEAEDLGGFRVVPIKITPPPTMDLSGNPYYTSPRKVRYTLLTPAQYAALPPDTVVYSADTDQAFLRGTNPSPSDFVDGHLMVGFPDNSQRGFEGHGTDACHKHFEALAKHSRKE
jgi:predicted unusual protein kinase regulating ubiquinone biosynthesis (AarF/ABC1/UbiB family)